MIKSMTGFGKGEGGGFVVEMRSVNHKFLDLSIKLPRQLLPLEGRVKKVISERFSRGRVDVYVTRGGAEEPARELRLDTSAAAQYIKILMELKDTFSLPGEVDMTLLTAYGKDIVTEAEIEEDIEAAWPLLETAIAGSMDGLAAMRAVEGETLAADISVRAAAIGSNITEVGKRAPQVVTEYAAKLKDRVKKLSEGVDVSEDRLAQEVALFADRCDITEEIVRAGSHLAQLDTMLKEDVAVGRKMDFLIQEINRELNTIGSKASDQDMARRVVEMKSELEKIREQAQNIE